jgi:hypothetical protein
VDALMPLFTLPLMHNHSPAVDLVVLKDVLRDLLALGSTDKVVLAGDGLGAAGAAFIQV